jgi:hypothetical protein
MGESFGVGEGYAEITAEQHGSVGNSALYRPPKYRRNLLPNIRI